VEGGGEDDEEEQDAELDGQGGFEEGAAGGLLGVG
jgi:hypothetical protein